MIKAGLYFTFIIILYLCPAVPVTVKGVLGVVFIIISNTESGFKGSLFTAYLLNVLMMINLFFHNNVDYRHAILNAVLGTAVYFFVAFYLGRSSERLKKQNKELKSEIDMRKNTEKELRESLAILASLMRTLPSPVCFKDLNYKFTGCNAAYEDYFELKESEILGKSSHELFDAGMADACLGMDHDLIEKRIRQSREVSFTSKGGGQKYFIFTKALLTDAEGKPSGIVSVYLDTTEHKLLKRSIEEEKLIINEMQKYDRLKTEFFSNISHELRTPLNVIFCAVQLMEMNINNREYPLKHITSIRQNSLRLMRLVNNLIDITKIDAQAFEISRRNRDIVYVIREIVISVADYAMNQGLNLCFHSDMEEKIMAFDEEKIERIILNLLSNAIKFSPPGGDITVNLGQEDGGISIRVKDEGIGIPIDRQEEIFQRFYQISPVNTRLREGSGIGLNLVKSLVEMHGGMISVDSACGAGTTFIIKLPDQLLPETVSERVILKDRQARIESIQLEFSDIYLGKEINVSE